MRKNTVAVAAMLTATTMLVTACGSKKDDAGSSSAKTLSILSIATPTSKSYAVLQAAIKRFEAKSGAKVTLNTGTGETVGSQFEASSLAGNESDLVQINPVGNARNYVKNGATVAVDDYVSQWGLTDLINPAALAAWKVDGKTVGIPYETFQWPLLANKDLLTKAKIDKVPTTQDELLAAVTKLKAAGITPWAIGGSDFTGQDLITKFVLMYLPDGDTKSVFGEGKWCNNQHVTDALTQFVKLREAGAFGTSPQGLKANDMNAAYNSGKAAMVLTGSWSFGDTPANIAAVSEASGIPSAGAQGAIAKPGFQVGYTSSGFMVSKNGAKKADLIKQFAQEMYSETTVSDMIKTGGYIPAAAKIPAAATADTGSLLGKTQAAIAQTDRIVPKDGEQPDAVGKIFAKGTAVAYAPGKTPADICKAIEGVYKQAG